MYTPADFEADIQKIRPRFFDTWVLPVFVAGYAVKSKGMGRMARRMLFSSGIYMAYRNYAEYKKKFAALAAKLEKREPHDT